MNISDYFKFIDQVEPFIETKLIKDARTIEYGQWEVPFEGLLLELIKLPSSDININFQLVKNLADDAGIIKSSILTLDTWENFENWMRKK